MGEKRHSLFMARGALRELAGGTVFDPKAVMQILPRQCA